MTINDGGPAFPMSYDNSLAYTYPSHQGMTLRDWFAGQALAGLLACGEAHDEHTDSVTAGAAYKMADAMLRAREVKP
jgi:hypothetical protein